MVLLAGCTSEDTVTPGENGESGDPQDSGSGEPGDSAVSGQAPAEWAVGHYWSYRLSFGGEFTLVVREDLGSDWYLGTTEAGTAWIDEREGISFLREVRKADLAGSQNTDRVQYYDFPLEDGKTWNTKWDGVDRRIVTVQDGETFRFNGYEGDDLVVEYDYDPAVGWFTYVIWYDAESGQETFSFELSDHQTGWTGQVVHWDAQVFAKDSIQGGLLGGSFDADGHEELWLRLYFHCEGEETLPFSSLTLFPAVPGQPIALGFDACMDEEVTLEIPDPEGTWVWQATTTTALDESGVLEFEIWGRTLVTTSVG
jgi:hypothetical protein